MAKTADARLPAHPSSVARARKVLREILTMSRREDLLETAQLLVSEVVTNALVHAGTAIDFGVRAGEAGLRVEVTDGSTHMPASRCYGVMAGTGRGLGLLQQLADRWGTLPRPGGKTVWFELGPGDRPDEFASMPGSTVADPGPADGSEDVLDVVLLNVPLLLHAAWQEHAEGLLREYLLIALETGDATQALERHAAASDAKALLQEHIPRPQLTDDPEELMTLAVEPAVSSPREVLPVPLASVEHFLLLDQALDAALAMADSGAFLTPPTQPELRDLRRWLCHEVSRQANNEPPTRWFNDPCAQPPMTPASYSQEDEVTEYGDEALITADDTDRIVAVSPAARRLLGYEEPTQLLGRRLIAIIPARYHQAHLAGFMLHLSNGRKPLLGRSVIVPVLRADNTEIAVELLVQPRQLPGGRSLFIARMRVLDTVEPHVSHQATT